MSDKDPKPDKKDQEKIQDLPVSKKAEDEVKGGRMPLNPPIPDLDPPS